MEKEYFTEKGRKNVRIRAWQEKGKSYIRYYVAGRRVSYCYMILNQNALLGKANALEAIAG